MLAEPLSPPVAKQLVLEILQNGSVSFSRHAEEEMAKDNLEVPMKCDQCGEPMTSARENYNYSASGLPYVTLVGVEVRRCKACGEHEVVLPRIEQLHRAIALAVIGKHARLTAAEVRYLRKYLGWSGADFAKHMGVTAESVSRWENDHERMGAVADRLLRLMVATKAPVSEYSLDALAELDEEPAPVRLKVESGRGGWRAEAVAA